MPPRNGRNAQGTPLIHIGAGATQAFSLAEQLKRIVAVAGVLEKAMDGSEEAVKHAHRVAAEIKAEAAQPQPNPHRLKTLLLSGIMAGVSVLDPAATSELIRLASHALRTI